MTSKGLGYLPPLLMPPSPPSNPLMMLLLPPSRSGKPSHSPLTLRGSGRCLQLFGRCLSSSPANRPAQPTGSGQELQRIWQEYQPLPPWWVAPSHWKTCTSHSPILPGRPWPFWLLLEKALQLVKVCLCVRGCPSCTWHTHCPSYNQRLDKGAAMVVLKHILAAEREKDVMALQPEG